MVKYTQSDYERQIVNFKEKLGLDFEGKTYGECVDIIIEVCPRMNSFIYLKGFALENLKKIERKFGFKALRLFHHDYIKGSLLQSFTGPDIVQMKYKKLLEEINEYHNNLVAQELELTLDYFNYMKVLEEVYHEEYGVIFDYKNRIYSILKTINATYYSPDVIKSLEKYLYDYLRIAGDKYYVNKDLTDKCVLEMLWEHIGEENYDEEVVRGADVFYDYDGYGNEYFIPDYMKSWTTINDDGTRTHHGKISSPNSTIEDYKKLGLPSN